MAGPFITPSEVAGRLGITFDAEQTTRVELLIDDVSASIAQMVGTDFTTGTATETHSVKNGRIILDRWPVISVTSVTKDGVDVDYTVDSENGILRALSATPVDVEYVYGYTAVPAVVKAVAAQMVGRTFGNPAHRAGFTSETTGPYTVQVGSSAAAGVAGMLNDERRLLESLKRAVTSSVGTIDLTPWTTWT